MKIQMTANKLADDPIQGFVSECSNCDFSTTTMDDAYEFCPLCGKPLNTWEEGEGKGKRVFPRSTVV